MNKRGQITIFIIVGLIIIGLIVLFIILKNSKTISDFGTEEINPALYLESCIEGKLKEGISILSLQGGDFDPLIYKEFKFEGDPQIEIAYLCYTKNYYVSCINREPLLISHLENEIKNYISDEVENCFNNFIFSLENQGYKLEGEYQGFNLDLEKRKIVLNIDAEITSEKAEIITKYNEFKTIISSRLYDLGIVAQEIVNQEAEFCNFDSRGYTAFYPQWKITKTGASDSTIIYTIEHKETKEKFRFAIRGCVIKEGI